MNIFVGTIFDWFNVINNMIVDNNSANAVACADSNLRLQIIFDVSVIITVLSMMFSFFWLFYMETCGMLFLDNK